MEHTLKIALVQTTLYWHRPTENRKHFDGLIGDIKREVDLIVLPEMFTTGFTMTPSEIGIQEGQLTLEWMKGKAREMNAALVGSMPFQDNGSYTNRLFFVEAGGEVHQYDKRHTFTLAGEHRSYDRGKVRLIIDYRGFRICPMICYDLRFPVWSRNTEDYDLLLYVANWPEPRINAWDTLLQARAIENMSYCLGVNRVGSDSNGHAYNGHSACYDALGRQMVFSTEDEVLYTTLDKRALKNIRKQLRFLDDRDSFTLR
jgi:predicted amidohydrolase